MTVLVPGRNLVLAGLMGTGKTTVGRLLADRLGRPFADTDEMVEAEAGASITEIFAERGERGFREFEGVAVRTVSAVRGQVVAVGGGALADRANVTQLHMTGDVVVLDGDPAVLAERVAGQGGGAGVDERPLLRDAEDLPARLTELRARRRQAYHDAAAHTVDTTGLTPDEVADQVLGWALRRPGLLAREERAAVTA